MKRQTQCLVSATDYAKHFQEVGHAIQAEESSAHLPKRYQGRERRANAHDRRFYAGQGGRRLLDRKS